MIVKDEAHIVRRCLTSVRAFIDCWVVVDTGSTDGTQDIVREALKDLPGQLHQREWKNFGHNRTEAIQLARSSDADYIFIIDADEVLDLPPSYRRPKLTHDAYLLTVRLGGIEYGRVCLVSTKIDWRYVGVLHEYLTADTTFERSSLHGPVVQSYEMEGGRSKEVTTADKYRRDAAILEDALKEEPNNERYMFYLAQSYRDAGDLEQALITYSARARMKGWDEETWYSLLQVAQLSERLNLDHAVVVGSYLSAFEARPSRAEPLVDLARYHRLQNRYNTGYIFARRAVDIPRPADILFVDAATYEWRALDELSIASYWTGAYKESAEICDKLLARQGLPENQRARVLKNRKFALDRLLDRVSGMDGAEDRR